MEEKTKKSRKNVSGIAKSEVNSGFSDAHDYSFVHSCVLYFIIMICIVMLRIAGGLGLFERMSANMADIVFNFVAQVLILFLIPLIGMVWLRKKPARKVLGDFGYDKPRYNVVLYSFALGFLAFFLNRYVGGFSYAILDKLGYRFPSSDYGFKGFFGFLIVLFLIAVLPSLGEETTHRGMMLTGLRRKLGVRRAVLITSILFGLFHLSVVQVLYTAVLGYIMATAVIATRSIWSGIIVHFVNNGLSVFFLYASRYKWPLYDVFDPLYALFETTFGFFVFLIFLFLIYYGIVWILHRFARENYKQRESVYAAEFVRANPEWIKKQVEAGNEPSLENAASYLEGLVSARPRSEAIMLYLQAGEKTEPLSILERTLLLGIIVLGSVVTLFTLVWGAIL